MTIDLKQNMSFRQQPISQSYKSTIDGETSYTSRVQSDTLKRDIEVIKNFGKLQLPNVSAKEPNNSASGT